MSWVGKDLKVPRMHIDIYISHMLHVWYIYLRDWVIYGVNVSKYSIHGAYGIYVTVRKGTTSNDWYETTIHSHGASTPSATAFSLRRMGHMIRKSCCWSWNDGSSMRWSSRPSCGVFSIFRVPGNSHGFSRCFGLFTQPGII